MGPVLHMHLGGKFTHDLGRSGDLADGLLFHTQSGQQSAHHQRRHLALHDHAHQVQHFIVKYFTVLNRSLQGFGGGDGHGLGLFSI